MSKSEIKNWSKSHWKPAHLSVKFFAEKEHERTTCLKPSWIPAKSGSSPKS